MDLAALTNLPERIILRFFACAGTGSRALPFWLCLITGALASPSGDLIQAVSRGGSASVEEASASQFLRAFAAVLVRAKPKEVVWYVNAAVKLRRDLADRIVVVALNVRISDARVFDKQNKEKVGAEISDIIKAAVTADPDAAAAIVKAAVNTEPFARDWIVAAAIAAAPEQRVAILKAAAEAESLIFVRRSGFDAGNMPSTTSGTINPASLLNNQNVNSPEQPPSGL